MGSLSRWGIWKRAGMSALVVGLDLAEAMASVPAEIDTTFVRRLFVIAESAYVPAALRHAKDTKED